MSDWHVYILKCSDGSLYTGITIDLTKRTESHNLGKGAKYTRSRRPVRLVYSESHETGRSARKREARIKSLKRSEKLTLISGK